MGPFRNHKNIKFSNNIFSDLMELDENEDNSIIQRIFSIDIDINLNYLIIVWNLI